MENLLNVFSARGDLAHITLFLWASGASSLLLWTMKELASANKRFDAFVRELARFNANIEGDGE